MELTDSPPAGGGGGLFSSGRRVAARSNDDTSSDRVRDLRSRLETTGGVVPSAAWLQQALDALLSPGDRGGPSGRGRAEEESTADAVFAQALHHDVRCVVDRSSPSRAATLLRNEIRRSMEVPNPGGGREGGGGEILGAAGRLLVQVEDVVNVALSVEARMQRQNPGDLAPNAPQPIHSSSTSPGSRCLKLQLVDGYQHPLQARDENPRSNNANNNSRSRSSTSQHVIVAMEIAPIPNLSEQTAAGTKLLLTLDQEDASSSSIWVWHGVLLLTPHNCLVVGGQVPDLAAQQARQRKALQEQSGASITDPTVRALVSNHYMTDADANADDEADVREGGSGDVPAAPHAVRTPAAPPFVTPHPASAAPARTPGVPARSTAGLSSGPPSASSRLSPAAFSQASVLPRRGASGMANNPYATSMPSQRATAAAMPPARTLTTSRDASSALTTDGRADGTVARSVPTAASAAIASNPYATKSWSASQAIASQRANDHYDSDGRTPFASTTVSSTQGPSIVRPVDAFSVNPPSTATQSTLSIAQAMPPPPLSTMPAISTRSSSPSFPSAPSQLTPFNNLFEQLHSATRQRPMYERLYGQTFYMKLVQLTPKLHFNIEKIPRDRRPDVSDDKASQRKHEYVLTARFRGSANPELCSTDPISGSITCKLASRVMEPFFLHSADDLRHMKKSDRARVDELVAQGGRNLQNWTIQEQLYRVKLTLNPDEYFATSPPPALNNDTVPLLLLDAP